MTEDQQVRQYALRKSIDSFSAGTKVDIVERDGDQVTAVPICNRKVEMWIGIDDLVLLRPRSRMVEVR